MVLKAEQTKVSCWQVWCLRKGSFFTHNIFYVSWHMAEGKNEQKASLNPFYEDINSGDEGGAIMTCLLTEATPLNAIILRI